MESERAEEEGRRLAAEIEADRQQVGREAVPGPFGHFHFQARRGGGWRSRTVSIPLYSTAACPVTRPRTRCWMRS